MTDALHCLVSGRVQGVYFRASTRDKATQLGLTGWVRNCPNGDVELAAFGAPAALEALLNWLHDGPALARVDAIQEQEIEFDPTVSGFQIR